MKRWLVSSMLLVACGGESPAPGLDAGAGLSGTPRTGGTEREDEPAPAPGGAALQREALAALVARAGVSVDLGGIAAQPIVRATVSLDEATRRFTARVDVEIVNVLSDPRSELVFVIPANASRPNDPPVSLDRVEIAGARVDPRGDRARWVVPVALAAGERQVVSFHLAGVLRARPPEAERPRDGVAAAMGMLGEGFDPFVGRAMPEQAMGEAGGVSVLHGVLPRLEGEARMTLELAVTAPADLTVAATGVEVGRERQGALTTVRFVAIDVPDAVVVAARGLASTPLAAGPTRLVALHPAEGGPTAGEALAMARRTIEVTEPAWRRLPVGVGDLTIVACPMLDGIGVAAAPGLVLVPSALFRGEGPRPKDDPLGAVLANHPAPRESLALAIGRAVAAQWWLGRGADPASATVLEDGVATVAALRALEQAHGDKAARRALTIGLRLPMQLGLDGDEDPILARLEARSPRASGKAALLGEELRRHLGDTLCDEAMRGLPAGPIELGAWRSAVVGKAPRPAETEALLARWLDGAHLSDDLGAPDPSALLEHLVTEGAADSGMRLALDLLGERPDLAARGLDALGGGGMPALALDLIDELTGDKDPMVRKWFDMAKGLIGKDRDKAIGALVDELGAELGIPESERARIRQMSELIGKALGGGEAPGTYVPLAPPMPAAPPAPAPPEPAAP
ncbi:MAG: hypothetical protein IT385_16515 [Deltaproteobacteria bacterium]|nr:hypothetical protein [Deltaproteobacteria bacterium]